MFFVQRWCQPPLGTKYYFDSFGDSATTEFLASGTVATTGQAEGDYIEVVVLSNSSQSEDFTGSKYWVVADAKDDGSEAYQLYTDAGETGTGMYVKIYVEAPTRSVSFTVTDGTDPIQSASVVIDDGSAKTTGSSGGCTASLTDGSHTLKVTKDGYDDYEGTITVSYEDTSFTVELDAQ